MSYEQIKKQLNELQNAACLEVLQAIKAEGGKANIDALLDTVYLTLTTNGSNKVNLDTEKLENVELKTVELSPYMYSFTFKINNYNV